MIDYYPEVMEMLADPDFQKITINFIFAPL